MMSLTPLHPEFGARLDAADWRNTCATEITRAVDRYGLLLIQGSDLDDLSLAAYGRSLGRLQNVSGRPDVERYLIHVTNLAEDGTIKPANELTRLQHEANLLWHTDSSFLSPGASYSLLNARIVTDQGGQTEFCDTRVGWEALESDRREQLHMLQADHSMMHSWRLTGVDLAAIISLSMPRVRRALAPIHAPTGRRALMIPSHVQEIQGIGLDETATLLEKLLAIVTAPARVYTHYWQPGDLLIWDNRCMLHRVKPYRGLEVPRDLRSCRVIDDYDVSSTICDAA